MKGWSIEDENKGRGGGALSIVQPMDKARKCCPSHSRPRSILSALDATVSKITWSPILQVASPTCSGHGSNTSPTEA
jgi:hypothetical protein